MCIFLLLSPPFVSFIKVIKNKKMHRRQATMNRPCVFPSRGPLLPFLSRALPRGRAAVRPLQRKEPESRRGLVLSASNADDTGNLGDGEELETADDLDADPKRSGSRRRRRKSRAAGAAAATTTTTPPPPLLRTATRPLPRVLVLHTGGTLGMDVSTSFVEATDGHVDLVEGTGGNYPTGLRPGTMLSQLLRAVPELGSLANLELDIPYNLDSSRVGPKEWVKLARILDKERDNFDAFLVISGTDTMSYVAAALSLMLAGFGKPIVLTGSQLPLQLPRSDARQNLVDALTCASAAMTPPSYARLREVAVCFGGLLLRGNRAQKVHSQA